MKCVTINPKSLKGSVLIPSSKSICHRAFICAGLSEGISNIEGVTSSKDIEATISAMASLGATFSEKGSNYIVEGKPDSQAANPVIDCLESGSTLRFLIPIAVVLGNKVTFQGAEGLARRPLDPYYEIFNMQKLQYKNIGGKLPLTIYGKLKPSEYRLKGDISSQFISGLLFALPLLDGDSKIIVTTNLESKSYVDLTIDTLKKHSISVENHEYKEFIVKGNQSYKPCNYRIEGDFSQAAFFLGAGIMGDSSICCEGLNIDSLQGDKVIVDIIRTMGGNIKVEENKIIVVPSKIKGGIIDASDCPDLVPILAVLAALSDGTTKIVNAGRLRIKESDRLSAITTVLNELGADICEKEDALIIKGKEFLKGGTIDAFNDHRIAMAAAIASLKCKEQVIIKGSNCVEKSYPDFWKDFKMLGGDIYEWSVGK